MFDLTTSLADLHSDYAVRPSALSGMPDQDYLAQVPTVELSPEELAQEQAHYIERSKLDAERGGFEFGFRFRTGTGFEGYATAPDGTRTYTGNHTSSMFTAHEDGILLAGRLARATGDVHYAA